MSKHRLPAGLRAVDAPETLCGAVPHWIKGEGSPAPRLLCIRRAGHRDKTHQDGRGHHWDVRPVTATRHTADRTS